MSRRLQPYYLIIFDCLDSKIFLLYFILIFFNKRHAFIYKMVRHENNKKQKLFFSIKILKFLF